MGSIEIKTPSYSKTITTEVVCHNDTNPMGILQGGRLVQWMDIAAAVCAQTHAGETCVTASIHEVDFNASARLGDMITINAVITRAFVSSMEIFVEAFAKNPRAGKKFSICQAYFTFVAINESGKPTRVNPVEPLTESELEHYNSALRRKEKKTREKRF
jgi:acyl-CoA hydrolase